MSSIFEKIDNGQGTLGGLVNDPTIHDDLKTILGGAKRSTILKYIIRQTIKNSDEDEQGKPDHKK
jgi:phospholipid/cholesterol/gamma-HCH transport system substrate-binding protein